MIILTTIYFAEPEIARDPQSGEMIEKQVYDIKDVDRKLVSVYQGTNTALPGDQKYRL